MAHVVECLSPTGDVPKPAPESQVRPLVGVPPEQMVAAWKKATAQNEWGQV